MGKSGATRSALLAMIVALSLWASIPTVAAAEPQSTRTAPRSNASFVQSGNAQWSWQNPLPQGNSLSSVNCPTTTTCVAVGDASTVIATQDGGSTWAGQHAGPGSDRPDLDAYLGVSCPGVTTCFAVRPAGIEATSNGGATWSSQSSVPATAISCATTVNCVATTKTSNVAITTDGGVTWSLKPTGTTQSFGAVSCPSPTTCYAVGGTVIKTVDGGNSWSTQGQLAVNTTLQSISCANLSSCVAVGLVHVLTTTDGGTTWVDHATQSVGSGVSCPSPSTCYAAEDYRISATTDGGNTWVVKSTTVSLRGINCPSTTICLAVGYRGAIMKTADGGTTWTLQSSGTTTTLAAVSCPTSTVCVAVGGGYWYGETATILVTDDGGATWSTKQVGTTASQRLAAVSCASATFCLAVGQGDGGRPDLAGSLILRTVDGGVTWTRQTPSFTTYLQEGVSCPTVSRRDSANVGWRDHVDAAGLGGARRHQLSDRPILHRRQRSGSDHGNHGRTDVVAAELSQRRLV